MADLESLIFGREPSADIQQRDIKTTTQKQSLDELLKLLSGEITTAPTAGELTPQELQGQELLSNLISGAGGIQTGIQEAAQFDPSGIDELFRTTIRDPLVKDVRENILPEISARYGKEFFGSERIGAEQSAIDQLVSTLAGERSKLVESERGRQLQALGLFPGFAAGAAGLAKDSDIAVTKASEEDRRRKELMQILLGGTGQTTFENIATVDPGSTGLLQGFLGGLGSGYGKSLGED